MNQPLGPSCLVPAPKTWVSNLQVFGQGPASLPCAPSVWKWPNILAGRAKLLGVGPTTWAFMPSACSKNLVPHLQVFGQARDQQVLPCAPSVWRWPNILARRAKLLGVGPTTWAFMPSACSKDLGFQSPSFWPGTSKFCLVRQVFGDGQTSWQG